MLYPFIITNISDDAIGIVLISNTHNTSAIYKVCLSNITRLNNVYRWSEYLKSKKRSANSENVILVANIRVTICKEWRKEDVR